MKNFIIRLRLLLIIQIFIYKIDALKLNETEFVDPMGYPFTSLDYLSVADAFLGGFGAYNYVPMSRDCIGNLFDSIETLNYTMQAWNVTKLNTTVIKEVEGIFSNSTDEEAGNKTNATYTIFDEEPPIIIYNLT